MKPLIKCVARIFQLAVRRSAWLGAAALLGVAPAHAASPPFEPAASKSIPERVAAVRERMALEGSKPGNPVFYRLSQFFNFPNFPNFNNFPNFPSFQNFPNFPNFPKF